MVSGSDRACHAWLEAYHIEGVGALDLHQFYRAMAWLGEELDDQRGATRAPRRTKDLLEEALFARRRSLFSNLSMVLFDTTSLMFTGQGGESFGQHGVSKDHRPDLRQVVVGVVLDEAGRPICSEILAGQRDGREIAAAGDDAPAQPLRHPPDVRGGRSRHDQCRDDRRTGGARHRLYPWRARAEHQPRCARSCWPSASRWCR